jgi:hypothetical protein
MEDSRKKTLPAPARLFISKLACQSRVGQRLNGALSFVTKLLLSSVAISSHEYRDTIYISRSKNRSSVAANGHAHFAKPGAAGGDDIAGLDGTDTLRRARHQHIAGMQFINAGAHLDQFSDPHRHRARR